MNILGEHYDEYTGLDEYDSLYPYEEELEEIRMKYVLISKMDGSEQEITREEAKEKLSRCYDEIVATYDEMLCEGAVIPLMVYNLKVVAE